MRSSRCLGYADCCWGLFPLTCGTFWTLKLVEGCLIWSRMILAWCCCLEMKCLDREEVPIIRGNEAFINLSSKMGSVGRCVVFRYRSYLLFELCYSDYFRGAVQYISLLCLFLLCHFRGLCRWSLIFIDFTSDVHKILPKNFFLTLLPPTSKW